MERLLGSDFSLRFRFWDGSSLGPPDPQATVVFRSPEALERTLFRPGELGLGRVYVAGDLDIEGGIFEALELRDLLAARQPTAQIKVGPRCWWRILRTASSLSV